jgi:hypothetical protein
MLVIGGSSGVGEEPVGEGVDIAIKISGEL